jgi:hypothetical protein
LARNGEPTSGVLSVAVVPPSPEHPVARLRITCNGTVFCRPDHLVRLAKFFQRIHDEGDAEQAYDEQKLLEPEMKKQAFTGGLLQKEVRRGGL